MNNTTRYYPISRMMGLFLFVSLLFANGLLAQQIDFKLEPINTCDGNLTIDLKVKASNNIRADLLLGNSAILLQYDPAILDISSYQPVEFDSNTSRQAAQANWLPQKWTNDEEFGLFNLALFKDDGGVNQYNLSGSSYTKIGTLVLNTTNPRGSRTIIKTNPDFTSFYDLNQNLIKPSVLEDLIIDLTALADKGGVGASCDDGDDKTENDVILDDCSCAGTPIGPNEGEIITESCGGGTTITYGNGQITMSGQTGVDYFYQILNEVWQEVYNCGWQCGSSKTVSSLVAGTYRVYIKDSNYQIICEKVITVSGSVPCDAIAGTLVSNTATVTLADNTALLSATVSTDPTIPSDFTQTYVLTSGTDLVIEATSSQPAFSVSTAGTYRIHNLVLNTSTLGLDQIVFGETTASEANSLLVQGGGTICAALDLTGAGFTVNQAGNNGGVVTESCGGGTSITYGNGEITMSGQVGEDYFYQVFDMAWNQLYNCGWQCGSSQTLSDLAAGDYRVYIKNSSYQVICEKVVTVSQEGNNGGGLITESCGGGTSITYGDGAISMSGQTGIDYFFQVFDEAWNQMYNCGFQCGNNKTVSGLAAGNYRVYIKNSNYQVICEKVITVSGGSGNLAPLASRNAPKLAFSAYSIQRQIAIEWATNSGWKNSHFEIEHSVDGITFETIGEQLNEDLSDDMKRYKQADAAPSEGKNYYRIKQIYMDGNFDYTETQQIDFGILPDFGIYPNPANEVTYLNLQAYEGKAVDLVIYNQFGQTVAEQAIEKVTGEEVRLDTRNYDNGLYIVRIVTENRKSISKRLVIARLY